MPKLYRKVRQTEKDFMAVVTDYAKLRGWRVYHTFDSRHSAAGFPDLVLVRPPRLVFAELKSEGGKLTPEQKAWIEALKEIGAFDRLTFRDIPEVYVWWPRDHEQVIETLK